MFTWLGRKSDPHIRPFRKPESLRQYWVLRHHACKMKCDLSWNVTQHAGDGLYMMHLFLKKSKMLIVPWSCFYKIFFAWFSFKNHSNVRCLKFFYSWSSYHSQVYNLVYIFTHHQKNNFPNVFIPSLKWEPHRNLQSTVFKYDKNILTPYLRLFSVYGQQFLWILKREDNK